MAKTIREQLRNNFVAIVSLVVAVTSLSYNTWRNEQSEYNRNVRQGGFQMLIKLGELQEVLFYSHYDQDPDRGNPRSGWAHVLVVDDLGASLPEPVPAGADRLLAAWERNWQGLGDDDVSAERISTAIDELRAEVLRALRSLE
jgi:hypothetical protein